MAKTASKTLKRVSRQNRIRAKVTGTESKPRVAVFRSNKNFSAQVINDVKGETIAAIHSRESKAKSKSEKVKELGALLAKKVLDKKVETVVFDRGGYIFTGVVKAFAEALRAGGLKF